MTPIPPRDCSDAAERHWAARYVARGAVAGEDCASFVARVIEDRYGHLLDLPSRAASQRGRDRQMAAAAATALEVAAPREGDVSLMAAVSRRSGRGHHVGVWCCPGGVPHVLHWSAGLVTLTGVHELPARGYRIVGYFRAAP